jgi:hypothetical protein
VERGKKKKKVLQLLWTTKLCFKKGEEYFAMWYSTFLTTS